jgi:hypothetical protein
MDAGGFFLAQTAQRLKTGTANLEIDFLPGPIFHRSINPVLVDLIPGAGAILRNGPTGHQPSELI